MIIIKATGVPGQSIEDLLISSKEFAINNKCILDVEFNECCCYITSTSDIAKMWENYKSNSIVKLPNGKHLLRE